MDGDNARVTIINESLLRRLVRCRAVCVALLKGTLAMRVTLAKLLWIMKYDPMWDAEKEEYDE